MDPVPMTIAAAVAAALVAAVLALWRSVVKGHQRCEADNKRCEEHGASLEAEIKATKDLLVKRSEEDVRKAEARETAAHERSVKFASALDGCAQATRDTKEDTRLALRVLRQYPPSKFNTPAPGSELDDATPITGEKKQP